MSTFEVGMLVCFGISWPISIIKTMRTKVVVGKSALFMTILCCGYVFGILHKVFYAFDWVIALYSLNLCFILIDLSFYFKYKTKAPVSVK